VDISILSKNSIKIHSKHANFIVDPSADGPKVSCDAVILLNNNNIDLGRVVDYRIIIGGPGEYEVNGVKVLGVREDRGFVYGIAADGFSVILGKSSEISKIKEDTFLCQIAILNVDDELNSTVVTKLEPKIVILYGDNKESAAKLLGKADIPPIKKFTVVKDKLPEEMEVVVLG
jgi:hypothetical protein